MVFLRALQEAGDEAHFHPHPFNTETVAELCSFDGEDIYCILVEGVRILGYAMLRGWEEGYEIPSLGIAVHPAERRAGLGKFIMEFLHLAARRRGAKKTRLRVYPHNTGARKLYERVGYRFESEEEGYLVGVKDV